MSNREEIIGDWLKLYPVRQLDYEFDEKNLATILVPHSSNWFTRTFLPQPKKPAKRIHLDEIGTFIWQHCDGQYSLQSICDKLKENFGEKVHSCEERTVLFTQQMYKHEFVKIFEKKEP